MDRQEVHRILNFFLEKCGNLEQDLHSAFKETEDWTESLRNDVKRLLNKETGDGLIIPKTPVASQRLRRIRLSVINECDVGDNGEHSKPKSKEPTNQLVVSPVSQELLSSSNNVNEGASKLRSSQRNLRKPAKSIPISESVQKANISDESNHLKRTQDESQVSVCVQDELVSKTHTIERQHTGQKESSKHINEEEVEVMENRVPIVPEIIEIVKEARLTRNKYSRHHKNRSTRSTRQTRSTYNVENECFPHVSSDNTALGETISENEGKEVQKNSRKKTSVLDKPTIQESSTKRNSSCVKKKSKRTTRKPHCGKISQDGMKSLHSSCSDGSMKFSSSGSENDLPNGEKNNHEMQEQDKILKETLVKEGNIDLQKQLCSNIQSHVPSSLTEDCERRGTFIKNSSTNLPERGTKFENALNNVRNIVSLDRSANVDTTDESVSNSPLINKKSFVKEQKCSSKLKDSSMKRESRGTNSKLSNSRRSGTKVTCEASDGTFGNENIKMKQHIMKSPEKQGMNKEKRNIVENDKSENTKNSYVEGNIEVQKNCVVVLYDCNKVSVNTNEKDRNVPEDKQYSEKGDCEENGTDLCDLSTSNLNLTSHSTDDFEENHTALSEAEVESFKKQCSSVESVFVSPSDILKVEKNMQVMGILKAKEMIKTTKRITRSKARALGGLESNGVPTFHMKTINYKKDNTIVQKCARTSIKKAIKTLASNQKHLDSKENSVVYQPKKLVNHKRFSSKVLSDVNISSSSLLNTSKKTPLTGPVFHFGSANKLIKTTAKPGVILTSTATFIKKKAVVTENKEEELKKKQEKENEAQRRREELLRKKIEDHKKKKEEQRLKVLHKREALEKEKQQLQERVEKDREVKQKDNILKKKLELERKAGVKRKIEEAGTAKAKRKQEELQVKAINDVREENVKHCEEEKKAIITSEKIVNKKLTVLLKTQNNLQKNAPEVCGLNTTWTEPTSADPNTTWVKPVVPSVSKPVNSTMNEAESNAYFLDDLMSEDSGEEDDNQSQKKPARWAKRRSKLLHESLLEMHLASKIRKILTCNQPILIHEMFPNKRLLRTSSAKWDTPPRYSTLPQY